MKYNPALDGLRAIAVAMVVGFHAMVPRTSGGYLGVDVFFVLSGYLITLILLDEIDRTGSIQLRSFYARRLTRLTPALMVMLGAYLLAAPWAWPHISSRTQFRDALIALFYFSDYASAIWSIPVLLRHTWSLSVEQHFYLIWPFVILLLRRCRNPRHMIVALCCMYVAFTAWRLYCDLDSAQGYGATYYRFDTRLSGLTAGALLATLMSCSRNTISIGSTFRSNTVALVAMATLGLATWRFDTSSTLAMTFGITGIEIATVALILVATGSQLTLSYRLLSHPALAFLGRMSYGIYLWHYPIFHFLWDRDPWYVTVLAGGALSVLLATISYYSVERSARKFIRSTALAHG